MVRKSSKPEDREPFSIQQMRTKSDKEGEQESWSYTAWKQVLPSTIFMRTKLALWAGPICVHLAYSPPNASNPYVCSNVF